MEASTPATTGPSALNDPTAPPSSSSSTNSPSSLTATYASPHSAPFNLNYTIQPVSQPSNVSDKTAYLRSLRSATAALQMTINKELTERMEEDKAREAVGQGKRKITVEDEKAEENYGEEVIGEDD